MQFADLLTRVSYLPPKDIEVLSRAYDAAASAHHDQNRLSGEKFIEHPLSVAAILEDLSFAQLHPDEYREIVKKIARKRKERETAVNDIKEILERELTSVGIKADTTGRPKHVYSIASKLAMGKEFEDIYDLSAIRVLTDSIKDCYGALGVIHSLWKPIPGRFKDYIAMPKSNGYQSLHTTVVSHSGEPMEIQIRTQ